MQIDPDGYMRILNNLIQNVISHSHADKIEIALSEQNRNNGRQYAGEKEQFSPCFSLWQTNQLPPLMAGVIVCKNLRSSNCKVDVRLI